MSDLDDLAAAARGASQRRSPPPFVRAVATPAGRISLAVKAAGWTVLGMISFCFLASSRSCGDRTTMQRISRQPDPRRSYPPEALAPSAGRSDRTVGSDSFMMDPAPQSSTTFAPRSSSGKTEHVSGYTRKDGRQVAPYNRRPSH